MNNLLIIGQGSQTIQLIRELYSLGYTPDQINVITINEKPNLNFLEFVKYYNLSYSIANKVNFDSIIDSLIKSKTIDLVISFSNPFIINSKTLSTSPVFINFHPGILPNYKGSLSTVYSLINKEKYVGGTWHYISDKVDCGNILNVIKVSTTKNSTAFSLNHKIFSLGISKLKNVLNKISKNNTGIKQEDKGKFYLNKFPNVKELSIELQKRVTYFPPDFI